MKPPSPPLLLAPCLAVTAPAFAAPAGFTIDPTTPSPVSKWITWASDQRGRFNKTAAGSCSIPPPPARAPGSASTQPPSTWASPSGTTTCAARTSLQHRPRTRPSPSRPTGWCSTASAGGSAEGSLTLLGVTRPPHLTISRLHCAPPAQQRETWWRRHPRHAQTLPSSALTKYIPSGGRRSAPSIAVEAFRE